MQVKIDVYKCIIRTGRRMQVQTTNDVKYIITSNSKSGKTELWQNNGMRNLVQSVVPLNSENGREKLIQNAGSLIIIIGTIVIIIKNMRDSCCFSLKATPDMIPKSLRFAVWVFIISVYNNKRLVDLYERLFSCDCR